MLCLVQLPLPLVLEVHLLFLPLLSGQRIDLDSEELLLFYPFSAPPYISSALKLKNPISLWTPIIQWISTSTLPSSFTFPANPPVILSRTSALPINFFIGGSLITALLFPALTNASASGVPSGNGSDFPS